MTNIRSSRNRAEVRNIINKSRDESLVSLKAKTYNYILADDEFLVAFLRTKKYSIDQATKSYENFAIFCYQNPEIFNYSKEKYARLCEIFRSGFVYLLPERDAQGRRILHINYCKLDPAKFNGDDIISVVCLLPLLIVAEEETQIAGVIVIFNYDNITSKHIGRVTPKQIMSLSKFASNASPGRYGHIYFVNLPGYAQFLIPLIKMGMNEKIKSRVTLARDYEEIKHSFDSKLLPKEYGGNQLDSIVAEELANFFETHFSRLKGIYEFEIDESKIKRNESNHEVLESFRKLEID